MNKLYILVPLICCIVFGAYYISFNKEHVAREEAKKAQLVAKAKADALVEEQNRRLAYDAAIKAQEQRKREKEERDRIEEEKKKARQDLEDRRERAFNERKRFREQVERLKKEVTGVEEEIVKVETEKKAHSDEQAFLKNYVKQAESNVKYYYDLLDKIDAAEKARAEAEKAAAAAKKS